MIIDFFNSQSKKNLTSRMFFETKISQVLRSFLAILVTILLITVLLLWSTTENPGIFLVISILLIASIIIMVWLEFSKSELSNIDKINLDDLDIKDSNINLIDYFSQDLIKVINNCWEIARKNKLLKIPSSVFLIALNQSERGKWLLFRLGFILDDESEKQFIQAFNQNSEANINLDFSDDFKNHLSNSLEIAKSRSHREIDLSDVLISLAQDDNLVKSIIYDKKINLDELTNILNWEEKTNNLVKKKTFLEKEYYGEGIGRSWAAGYTPTLNLFAVDFTPIAINSPEHYQTIGQQNTISQIEQILTSSGKNNIMLIGDDQDYKKSIVSGLAQKISQGKVNESLRYKHIFFFDTSRVLMGNKEEIEYKLIKSLNEAISAGNVILYIDNFVDLVTQNDKEKLSAIDASATLLPYLSSGSIQIITSVNSDEFRFKIETAEAIKNSFSIIKIDEPKKEEMINLVEDLVVYLENRHQVFFSYQALKDAIELSDRYIHDKPFPSKTIEILDQTISMVASGKRFLILPEDVEKIISLKTNIPVSNPAEEEKETLLNLEKFLHERVVGQEEAISAIANAMRRARSGLGSNKKPMGSFLFLGPTGVGKTETAKALAQAYFKSEKNIVRFDMSEFQQIESINLLIGSKANPGAEESKGRLTDGVRNNPYSLILLDEIEKAHPNVLNLFLQVLDEGELTDSAGRKVDFTNTIIIATSNAGSEKIRENLEKKFPMDQLKKLVLDYLQEQGIFKPEFLNRFDGVVCYKPLSQEEISEVAKLMINSLNAKLKEKDLSVKVGDEALNELVKLGYDPMMGARPMKRIIQEKVENLLANKILADQVQRGESIEIKPEDLK